MKLAIFENEYEFVEGSFKAANMIYFNDSLELNIFSVSQKLSPFTLIENFDFIFIDVDLSPKSTLNGVELAKKIIVQYPNLKNRIIFISGSTKVQEKLEEKKLTNLKILSKPFSYKDIYNAISPAV